MASAPNRHRIQFVTDFYVAEVHAGVVDYARGAGWVLLDSACYLPALLPTYDEPCDGVLAIAAFPQLQSWLLQRAVPVVRMICVGQHLPFSSVEPDPRAIGAKAAEYFITLGNPHFAYYCYGGTRESAECWAGFSEVLREAGREPTLLDFSAATAQPPDSRPPRPVRWAWLRDRLSELPRPLAVLAEDDRFLGDVFEAAAMLGWRVPEDIAAMGQDDRPLILGKLPLPATSMDTGLRRIGYEAAALLDRLIGGEPAPREVLRIPPGQVVVRRSTEAHFSSHEGISAAITFLRRHFREPLALEAVAREAGLSRRTLQSLFREAVGHSFSEELARLRLDAAARLLRETGFKLESVAQECGLGTARNLCTVFRKNIGPRPQPTGKVTAVGERICLSHLRDPGIEFRDS